MRFYDQLTLAVLRRPVELGLPALIGVIEDQLCAEVCGHGPAHHSAAPRIDALNMAIGQRRPTRVMRHAQRPPGAQTRPHLTAQRAAPLHIQRLVATRPSPPAIRGIPR
jgi:hypothetical protein